MFALLFKILVNQPNWHDLPETQQKRAKVVLFGFGFVLVFVILMVLLAILVLWHNQQVFLSILPALIVFVLALPKIRRIYQNRIKAILSQS
ncbi:hypothetical protein [Alysiella crassa]|uniref:Uncharacterized protein n=1 Tax=Alysiella crassa TaxID=153491 RepID=A0A376BVT4_9NEIS|nr:hypothetical protein [Alysiella crassa]UOP05995.1 hypothetical protein LVJ80_09030 [Alysiella crassa]SSY80444.1 Uncharacterised protein [Alysiella crassa]